MDRIVGRAMDMVDLDRTLFLVCSDHGFSSFRHQFNYNTWLVAKGYMKLKKNVLGEPMELDDLNNNVNRSHCIASSEDLACENNDNVVWGWTSPRIIVLDLNTRIEFYLDRYDGFAGSNSFQISALYNELPG